MLIPFGDYPNPPKAQWVTRILLGLNVLVYLFLTVPQSSQPLTVRDWEDPSNREAFDIMLGRDGASWQALNERPAVRDAWLARTPLYSLTTQKFGYVPGRPSLLALFFCMFLHGDFFHVAGNMLYLWIFGDNVEFRLGKIGYVLAYLGTGVAATLGHSALDSHSLTPLVGASGAISGVLGLYLIWFPHNQVRVIIFLLFIMVVHVRAVWVLAAYLVFQFVPLFYGGRSNIAHGAHLAGFGAGMALAWVLNAIRGKLPAPRPAPYVERRAAPWVRTPHRNVDHREEFHQAIARANFHEAAHSFSQHVQGGGAPPDPAAVFQLARWLYEAGLAADAASVFRYYVASYPDGADLDRVHLGLGVLLARRLGHPLAAKEHLHQAIELAQDPSIADIARLELTELEGPTA